MKTRYLTVPFFGSQPQCQGRNNRSSHMWLHQSRWHQVPCIWWTGHSGHDVHCRLDSDLQWEMRLWRSNNLPLLPLSPWQGVTCTNLALSWKTHHGWVDITVCIFLVLMNCRKVSIHDKCISVDHSETEGDEVLCPSQESTHWSGSSAQLFGRFTPGWGHAAQNVVISGPLDDLAINAAMGPGSSWCSSAHQPLHFECFKDCHSWPALRGSLYQS